MTVTISQYRIKIGYFDLKTKPKNFYKIDAQNNSNIGNQHLRFFQYSKIFVMLILLTMTTTYDSRMTKNDTINATTNLSHNNIIYTHYDYGSILFYLSYIFRYNSFVYPIPISHQNKINFKGFIMGIEFAPNP